MKEHLRFGLLIFMLYGFVNLAGSAIMYHNIVNLIVSSIWLGITLILFPAFHMGGDE